MRKFFCYCLFLFTSLPVYADNDVGNTANLIFSTDPILETELDTIKNRLLAVDADFVASLGSMPLTQQVRQIRGFLAQKSFEYYDKKYTQMLQDASNSTGRAIKTDTQDLINGMTREKLWLDRGELDNANLCYNTVERRACDYPDGFEDFDIEKDTGGTIQTLRIDMDDKESNTHYEIYISLTNTSDNYETTGMAQQFDNIVLRTTVEEYNYDEWYAWRNQEMADVRAGKYIPVTENEKPAPNSPFSAAEKIDNSREWKSIKLPNPRMHGRIRNYSQSSSYTPNNTNE